jgi:hypothetical protein
MVWLVRMQASIHKNINDQRQDSYDMQPAGVAATAAAQRQVVVCGSRFIDLSVYTLLFRLSICAVFCCRSVSACPLVTATHRVMYTAHCTKHTAAVAIGVTIESTLCHLSISILLFVCVNFVAGDCSFVMQ